MRLFKRKPQTPAPGPPPLAPQSPPPGQFMARYDGECAACGDRYKVGDAVGRVMMARRRIGSSVADDPYSRVCCGRCHADAAVNGDPSLRW